MAEALTFMAVHAHPDDEVFGTGGTFAWYAEQGIHTVLVTCTGGEEGEIVDPTMVAEDIKPRLAEVRLQELRCAVGKLGIETLEMLGYRDSGMAGAPANQNPACFHMADMDEATERLVRLIRRYRPQVLVSYDENGSYGHPDHIKAYHITRLAFDAAGDPARFPEAGPAWQPQKLYEAGMARGQLERWLKAAQEAGIDIPWIRERVENPAPRGLPQDKITTTVLIGDYLDRKQAAFRCHRSQIRDDSPMLSLPAEVARKAFVDECFIRVRSLVEAPLPEDDLFAGVR
ncbi:MAG TPA: PIG-L family deacetylase [Chloroflexota bacterium]|nr:PIG-L family deacetylase [Chloroflexota bacterium]